MNLRGGEVLPDWKIRELMQKGVIIGADESLVNPSSLDLRVSAEWYKVLGSFLPPEDQKVEEALKSYKLGKNINKFKLGDIFYSLRFIQYDQFFIA